MADRERLSRADVVIDTSGTIEETRRRTLEAWNDLKKRVS
jgi:dephospho-CoA kinase